ncbi:MAG: nitrate/sulfonate/bicarbonate ABC transporter ATP-binding protein [Candidatus Omnitrophica bacterium CG11_big_fil_rev_8_21_14_0_20_63_9]|nr:MAG: nitrate/sulfonate/bicarbonate ABC transporter ATP-binding protein [Candidatus Omnitrophica bacterium CG11_big_fil_rev_8_21_14_0_20_63_9]
MRVELQHVSKSFRHNGQTVEVLHDINLTVAPGEFVCLLGPTGCGKSTIVNLVAGLETPNAGTILVDGRPIAGPGPRRVVVFQDAALFPWLTVLGNVEFGLRMARVPKTERHTAAMAYIKLVHLSKFAHAYPHQLSGGMRQRAAIARALVMQPDILLMDEPFGALDAQTRAVLQEELLEIWRRTGCSILFVTHNIREATGLADRVYVISSRPGRIRHVEPISTPRPRHAENPSLVECQRKILGVLEEEIEKVMRDELGESIHIAHDQAGPNRLREMHS